jgi:hypothetical protein
MPVHKVIVDGKVGYKWGQHGKVYFGRGAASKAAQQGQAAYAAGYKGAGSTKGN